MLNWLGDKLTAAEPTAEFSRALRAADMGLRGAVMELRGTVSVKDGLATMRVDMIKGTIANPLAVVKNMVETAKGFGATTLRIEGTIANERLYEVLVKRYGLKSAGAIDYIVLPLK